MRKQGLMGDVVMGESMRRDEKSFKGIRAVAAFRRSPFLAFLARCLPCLLLCLLLSLCCAVLACCGSLVWGTSRAKRLSADRDVLLPIRSSSGTLETRNAQPNGPTGRSFITSSHLSPPSYLGLV